MRLWPCLAVTAQNLFTAGSNPYVWDIAQTTRRYQRTGDLSMIDEVFVFYDLYMVTNEYFSSNVAYDVWLNMQGF